MTAYRLELTGNFRLTRAGELLEVPLAGQRLLAFLALTGVQHRQSAIGALWPGHPAERSMGNLRSVLWRINRVAPGAVVPEGAQLRLEPAVDVDVVRLAAACRSVLRDGREGSDVELIERRWPDLLVTWDDDWLRLERQRLRQLRLHAQEALADTYLAFGDVATTIELALQIIGDEPLRESAHRCLVKAYLAEGNYIDAFRQYDSFRALLYDALGVCPSPQLEELLEPIRATSREFARRA